MKLLEKILIATDLGPASDEIVKNGSELAKLLGAKIVLLYVLDLSNENPKIQDFLLKATKASLNRIKEEIIAKGIECEEPVIASGSAYNEIVREASINEVNLIFIGSGNEKGKTAYSLGLNAKKIIQKTKIPVWVNKPNSNLKISKILCPIDFSDSSALALKNAIVLSKKFNSKLYVLNVYESVHPVDYLDVNYLKNEIENERKKNENEFHDFLSNIDFRGVKYETILLSGFPDIEILAFIREKKIDLLIIGTTGKSGIAKLFLGSTTEKVIRELPCSFITTKSKDLIKLVIETKMNDIDTYFREAELLFKDGFFEKAIQEYNLCLDIDPMHIRSLKGISSVYDVLGDKKKAKYYHDLADEVYKHMWDEKIEKEVRKNYQVKGDYRLHH